jgi:hypothetical protein
MDDQHKSREEIVVSVRRQWNSWRSATCPLDKIEKLHWSNVSGGVNAFAPRDFLHGYILCTDVIDGELDHSCEHGAPPHRIKVCIVKTENKKVWPQILAAVPASRG